MFRTILVAAATLCAALLIPPVAAQSGKTKASEPLKGQIEGEKVAFIWYKNNGPALLYMAEVPVILKGGESITVAVTVVGKDRTVVAALQDPKGAVIGGSAVRETKTTRFTVTETNATGEYKIMIGSDLVGDYTLTVTGPAAERLNKKALEQRLERLKKEVQETEAAIRALEKKEEKK